MKKKEQLLVIPITFWSGIEQGFFGADFTAVSDTYVLTANPQILFFRDLLPAHTESTQLDGCSSCLAFATLQRRLVLVS